MAQVIILGANGMLGRAVYAELKDEHDVIGTVRSLDPVRNTHTAFFKFAAGSAMLSVIRSCLKTGGFVVNCVGVIKQRPEALEPVTCIETNALLPHQLAKVTSDVGGKLIHISTDCVFTGSPEKSPRYWSQYGNYTEEDQPDATDLYGRTKALGEVGAPHLTLRTSIIGREEPPRKYGLLEWLLSQEGDVPGHANARWSGVTTDYLAWIIGRVVAGEFPLEGLYHVASLPVTKADLLERLQEAYNGPGKIIRVGEPRYDRTLQADKFFKATGLAPPSWLGGNQSLVTTLSDWA